MRTKEITTESDTKFRVNRITCKTILSQSRIPGIEFCINPYIGCQHGCVYCYARFMNRFSPKSLKWGTFADVKINALEVLKKQLLRSKKGNISLSTVTDPYQPLEGKYEITRNILVELAAHGFEVSILTKSDLVERDIDVLKRFNWNKCEVGFSITSLDEEVAQNFEKHAPPVRNRIKALKRLHQHGIKTWVFIAPVLPFLTQHSIYDLLNEIKGSVDYIMMDRLNIKYGNWQGISDVLKEKYPSLLSKWKAILFSKGAKNNYFFGIQEELIKFSIKNQIKIKLG